LLLDGIGDTIRVSLSEEPEAEIPVGRFLVSYIADRMNVEAIEAEESNNYNRYEYSRRITNQVGNIGGENVPVVIAPRDGGFATIPDFMCVENGIMNAEGKIFSVFKNSEIDQLSAYKDEIIFLKLSYSDLTEEVLKTLTESNNLVVLLSTNHKNGVGEQRAFFHKLLNNNCKVPVIISRKYAENDIEKLQIKSATDLGVFFIDGFGDGIFLENEGKISIEAINSVAFGILQATRVRITKTEFISCPSCGRTMFNLQTVIARIKARTSHLKGLKIGIMGCIVNGPGEMADADYGYVGAGRGKVSLYKKKECLERNIAEDEAVEKLIDLIKLNGDWHE